MKIELSDLSGLPEGLQAVVESEGDKHSLDLTKLMPAEDLTGLKNTVVNLRDQVGAWGKLGKHPDDVQNRIADLEKQAKGTGKGAEDAQAKLDAMKADYDAKLTERDTRLESLMKRTAGSELKAELAKAGFISEAIDDIAATAMGRLQFNEDGTPKVLTSDGKPMIGSGADHGATLADLAKELAQAKPYAVRHDGKPGSGKPPGSNGGKPAGTSISEKELAQMSPQDKAKYFAANPDVTVTD